MPPSSPYAHLTRHWHALARIGTRRIRGEKGLRVATGTHWHGCQYTSGITRDWRFCLQISGNSADHVRPRSPYTHPTKRPARRYFPKSDTLLLTFLSESG